MTFNRRDFVAKLKDRWAELDESQRSRRRWGAGLILLALVLAPAWWIGRPWWARWQREQALAQVTLFAQKNDYRSATLALRRAVQLAPDDPATWRAAVTVLGEIGSAEVLMAREQLVRLSPEDVGLKLALAREALRMDRLELAEQTLAAIEDASRRDEAFFRLSVALAEAMGRGEEMEALIEELAQVRPDDVQVRLVRAAVRLWSIDEKKSAEARGELEELTGVAAVQVRAALELLKDATRQHDDRRTAAVMTLLLKRFAPEWPATQTSTSRAAWTLLTERMKSAALAAGAREVAALARWLADTGQPREMLVWLESQEPRIAGSLAVRDIAAQLSAELGDLERVENYLRAGAWGSWPRETLTLAIAARLQRLRYGDAHARATWSDAITSAGGGNGLRALVRLAQAWKVPEDFEAALQAAAETGESGAWAFEALETIYDGRRDLTKLWSLYENWARVRATDDRVAAKWITLAALLNRVTEQASARAAALKESAEAPGNGLALAAWRWRMGKPNEAIALLKRLPAAVQEQEATTFWRALAEADLGNKNLARMALENLSRRDLAPEEQTLIRAAASKIKLDLRER